MSSNTGALKPSAPCDVFARVLDHTDRLCEALTRRGLDEEECEIVDTLGEAVDHWADKWIDPARIDREAHIPSDLLQSAAELGLFGLSIPEQYGGAGLSMRASASLIDGLAFRDLSVATSVGLHCGLGVQPLVQFGPEALAARYLPELASGQMIAAFSATEANAGSDLGAVQASATRVARNQLSVSGSKLYVTNGGFAGLFTVLVRAPELRRHHLVLVPRDTAGVSVAPPESKLGLRGSATNAVYFDNSLVPADHVIGVPGRGRSQLNTLLSWGRLIMASGCVGGARSAYALACDHVGRRVQFGRVLGSFGQVRKTMVEMQATIYAMESAVRLAGELQAWSGDGDIRWESSVVKVFCSESAWQISDQVLQLHGGSGFIEDTGVARLLRDARIARIFEGSNEVLRIHLAAQSLMFPFDESEAAPRLCECVGAELVEDAETWERLNQHLISTLGSLGNNDRSIFSRQLPLFGLSEALIASWTLLASILRCEGARRQRLPSLELELALVRYLSRKLHMLGERGLAAAVDKDTEALVDRIYTSGSAS